MRLEINNKVYPAEETRKRKAKYLDVGLMKSFNGHSGCVLALSICQSLY